MAERYSSWLLLWPYTILMIFLASWVLYHFLAPASWRERAGAGLVQAFIIALYAEMYGFPLTIYVLTAALGIEIPLAHSSGHLRATLLGYGRLGAIVEMAVSSIFIVGGLLLIVKGWVRIYSSDGQLATDGVYAIIRHAQYGGILIAIFGQLVYWPTIPTLALAPVIFFAYMRLARHEESRLVETFGATYQAYQRRVPMFLPVGVTWTTSMDEAFRHSTEQWGFRCR